MHNFDEDDEMEQENRLLQLMMTSSYVDAEIDKLLETLGPQLNNNLLNGELIENDIRLSEEIRDAIEEVH